MPSEPGSSSANSDQANYWNSDPGQKWIVFEDRLDAVFQSVNDRLLEHAMPTVGERVLDVGCGTGATTMDIASCVGANGSAVGVDISRPLLERAEARRTDGGNKKIHYLLADAQTHEFEADDFDLITSRFGVMFFGDPVKAFRNLYSTLRVGGRLSFVSWAPMAGNPWFEVPRDAAVARLGNPAPATPRAPGPLAFQDTDYVLGILKEAGYSECSASVETVSMHYPGTVEEVASLASNIGPAVRIVRDFGGNDEDLVEIGKETTLGFEQFVVDDGVRIPAILNFFDAAKR
jgi:SAM-dependent methyltransferase